ncbi:MAG TPA: hypothetical protein VNL35_08630 [Chloroflexota bacterium]|nr:hypothetical protein [Chloroflexota bacterium]
MEQKGVTYDVGTVTGISWRPEFDPCVVQRELAIIKSDPHCTAVRIGVRDVRRLTVAAETALAQGMEVWLLPTLWNQSPRTMLAYMTKAAGAAEKLRARWPEQVVFLAGGELTWFMQRIIPGKSIMQRLQYMMAGDAVKSGLHNKPLNAQEAKE